MNNKQITEKILKECEEWYHHRNGEVSTGECFIKATTLALKEKDVEIKGKALEWRDFFKECGVMEYVGADRKKIIIKKLKQGNTEIKKLKEEQASDLLVSYSEGWEKCEKQRNIEIKKVINEEIKMSDEKAFKHCFKRGKMCAECWERKQSLIRLKQRLGVE